MKKIFAFILLGILVCIPYNNIANDEKNFLDIASYIYYAMSHGVYNESRDYEIGDIIWQYQITGNYDTSPKAIAPINDIDGDGIHDVIVCSEDYYIRCFSGGANGTGIVIWEHEIYAGSVFRQNALAIIDDINGDGYDDVIVGAAWSARLIRAISGLDGSEIWTHDTHEYGDGGWVYEVDCSYDYNGDGIPDVLAATGDDAMGSGPKRVYCLDALTGSSIWECPLGGPVFSVIGIEDFTGDGQPDVLAGASNEPETEGYVYAINGATGNVEWSFVTSDIAVWALEQLDDINGDGIKDVIAGDFNGNIYGLNAINGNVLYTNSIFPALITRFAKLDDVNGDGYADIVPSHSATHVVMAIDGYTGSFIWTHSVADQPWNVDRIADVSGDGINDVIVGTLFQNNYCYFLNGVNGSEIASIPYYEAVDAIASIPDVVGDGSMEMVAGGRNGKVTCFSGGKNASVNHPPENPIINGSSYGIVGIEYEYSFISTDEDGDDIYYYIDWGDGSYDYLGPFPSGIPCNASHSWQEAGNYSIKAMAEDIWHAKSDWSIFNVEISNIFSFNLSLHEGWNFITLPLKNDYNASMLYDSIPYCSIILKWNASLQKFEIYVPGSPYDFTIDDGIGYFIAVTQNSSLYIEGVSIESVSIHLYIGWNALGWFKQNVTNASLLYNAIAGCNIVLKWNVSEQDFMLYVPGSPYDFEIRQGEGFLVAVDEESIWHG